jgi:hypothetical protein
MRRAKTFLGAILLATTLALSAPGVEVKRTCEAAAQSCDAATGPAAPGAAAAPSCPASREQEAALAAEEAAVARLRRDLAAQAAAGQAPVPLNGRGYNYGPEADANGPVLRFEATPLPTH